MMTNPTWTALVALSVGVTLAPEVVASEIAREQGQRRGRGKQAAEQPTQARGVVGLADVMASWRPR